MVPVIELRGAIPFGVLRGLPEWEAAIAGTIGSILPVPFILIFIRRILRWLRTKTNIFGRIAVQIENTAVAKSTSLKYKSELLALVLFVGIPLPGTGAWTGALIAALLKMRVKTAFPAIAAGVVLAAVIMTVISTAADELFQRWFY